jgi:hypothetical protein
VAVGGSWGWLGERRGKFKGDFGDGDEVR